MPSRKTYSSLIETALAVWQPQNSRSGPTTTSPIGWSSTGSFYNLLKVSILEATRMWSTRSWLGKSVYRRTVDLSAIRIQ